MKYLHWEFITNERHFYLKPKKTTLTWGYNQPVKMFDIYINKKDKEYFDKLWNYPPQD